MTSFFNKVKQAYDLNFPFVVFRKPNEKLITGYFQNSKELNFLSSFSEQGFVFAPFDKNQKKIFFSKDQSTKITSEISQEEFKDLVVTSSIFKDNLNETSKENHIQLVQKGINFINKGNAKKIVLSRKEHIKIQDLDVFDVYKKMLYNYQNAFVYLWYHPSIGLWMGATPERLLSVADSTFKTMALAGTQLNEKGVNSVWKDKEQQEQKFVTDFIFESTKPYLNSIKISAPYTVEAGNVVHIRTDISGDLISPNLLSELVSSLHPTPAICGLPKAIATEFILKNEAYNRSYYSGFLGEINNENSTELFVNLRCMELKNKEAVIYIGGGITKDSIAENEWKETVAKSKVMKKVL
ncbi:MAG: chorismate-binding protein [Lutibacter sp.]|nr:chorismate-binding protein [Lutibacter sp.]NNJ56930.1 chorismate-binding protein [Lutibacter sp.]